MLRRAVIASESCYGKQRPQEILFSIDPARVAKLLFALALCLIMASGAVRIALHLAGPSKLLTHLNRLFYADLEANFPTFFSGALLLISTALLSLIASIKRRDIYFPHWCFLAAIFVFLAVDELTQLHESIINASRHLFHASGYLYYAWVIPYGTFSFIVFVLYVRFLLHLPARSGWLFILAGACYVGGAIGFEMLDAAHQEAIGEVDFVETILVNIEELLEMSGVIVFIYALLSYIGSELPSVRFRIPA